MKSNGCRSLISEIVVLKMGKSIFFEPPAVFLNKCTPGGLNE
jgi:hypothetical protein